MDELMDYGSRYEIKKGAERGEAEKREAGE